MSKFGEHGGVTSTVVPPAIPSPQPRSECLLKPKPRTSFCRPSMVTRMANLHILGLRRDPALVYATAYSSFRALLSCLSWLLYLGPPTSSSVAPNASCFIVGFHFYLCVKPCLIFDLIAPAQEAIAYETKLWNEDVWTAGLYRGEPSDEVDEAWSDLYNGMYPQRCSLLLYTHCARYCFCFYRLRYLTDPQVAGPTLTQRYSPYSCGPWEPHLAAICLSPDPLPGESDTAYSMTSTLKYIVEHHTQGTESRALCGSRHR